MDCIRTSASQTELGSHTGDISCMICNPIYPTTSSSNGKDHWHHCPECYLKIPCQLYCSIEPDLEDNGREFGSHCVCDICRDKKKEEDKYKSKEFWDRYNGYVK